MPRKPPALAALDVASPPAHSAAAEAYAAAGRDNADALIGKESFATSDGSVRVDQQGRCRLAGDTRISAATLVQVLTRQAWCAS